MRVNKHFFVISGSFILLASCGGGEDEAIAKSKNTKSQPAVAHKQNAISNKNISNNMVDKSKDFNPCILSVEEVSKATGWSSSAGKANISGWQSYGTADCKYEEKNGLGTFYVNFTWVDPQYLEQTKASMHQFDAGMVEKIEGDEDGAFMQYQKGLNSGALHYTRANIIVEIRPTYWKASKTELKEKLLALRRVP
ncbi:hypothetical protein LPB140_07665 [Sphingorhabdus lutea]|uniref:DUF3558 domain-containing protein n=1 Tax=Sphingorhabdus lutea TaxID=1913578 RepID=A0A1L3JC38_9SPHN|nr:hypothetical protein [Sphingorhabdus lutea]APG62688.1 hypothetical protein LPB140_07665 [Sphingorhabdus lutea]